MEAEQHPVGLAAMARGERVGVRHPVAQAQAEAVGLAALEVERLLALAELAVRIPILMRPMALVAGAVVQVVEPAFLAMEAMALFMAAAAAVRGELETT